MTQVIQKEFGSMPDGTVIYEYTLTNNSGSYVSIINYGATITAIVLKQENTMIDVALGYTNLESYVNNGGYLGACIGRVGNRIGNARFTLNEHEYALAVNDGINHLHGGNFGFDKQIFDVQIIENGIRASRMSPDGEENYPGNLMVSVDYLWDDNNTLTIAYDALSDEDTIINLTNHTYFNLSGESDGSVLDHELTINAHAFTEGDAGCLPTGIFIHVYDTPFDFTKPRIIGDDIDTDHIQLKNAGGYDHNFVLEGEGFRQVALARSPKTNISMEVATDMPGMQFYSGNFMEGWLGKSGTPYIKRSGFCLETQYFPNAMACKNFPSIVLPAGKPWKSTTTYKFTY